MYSVNTKQEYFVKIQIVTTDKINIVIILCAFYSYENIDFHRQRMFLQMNHSLVRARTAREVDVWQMFFRFCLCLRCWNFPHDIIYRLTNQR